MLTYIIIAGVVGYINSIKPVCPAGYRAISVDGSKSLLPGVSGNIVTPTTDYPICSPQLSCPTEGQKYAFHRDGSALTNSCEEPNCSCTAFQHCPAYASTIFRQFGYDDRISYFQVVDPLAKDPQPPKDPFDVPYLLGVATRDTCFLNSSTIHMMWPSISLGQHCLRGTLAKIKTNPSLYVCAPSQYVNSINGDWIFDVDSYMNAYRT